MKKLSFLLLLFACISYSQEYATTENGQKVQLNKNGTYKYIKPSATAGTPLYDTDFKKVDGKIAVKDKKTFLILADKTMRTVDFTYQSSERQFSTTTVADLNMMVANASLETMFKMKNKYSYLPRSVYMYFSENVNKWVVSINYTAENDYGGSKEGNAVCYLTKDGLIYDIEFK